MYCYAPIRRRRAVQAWSFLVRKIPEGVTPALQQLDVYYTLQATERRAKFHLQVIKGLLNIVRIQPGDTVLNVT